MDGALKGQGRAHTRRQSAMLSLIHVRTQRAEWGPARHRSAGLFDLGLPASRAVTSRSMSAVQAAQSWYFVKEAQATETKGEGTEEGPSWPWLLSGPCSSPHTTHRHRCGSLEDPQS